MDEILELRQLAANISEKLDNANFELMGSIELSSLRRELENLHRRNLQVKESLRFNKDIDTADYDEYSKESEKIWEFVQRRLPPVIEAHRNKIRAAQERLKRKREIELLQRFNAENIKRLEAELADITAKYNNAGTKELKEVYEVPMKALMKAIEKCKKLYAKYDKELAILIHDMDALMKGGELTPIKPKRKYTRRKKVEAEKEEVKEEVKEVVEKVEEAEIQAEEVKENADEVEEEVKVEETKAEVPQLEEHKEPEVIKVVNVEEPKVEIPKVEPVNIEPPKEEVKEELVVTKAVPTSEEHAQEFADNLPPLIPNLDGGTKTESAPKVEYTKRVETKEEPVHEEHKEETYTEEPKKKDDVFSRVTPIIPRVKNRNSRLGRKVLRTVALTVGIGGAVYLVAGPLGVITVAAAAYVGKKIFDRSYEKFKEAKMTSLGGSVKVNNIEEPSSTVMDRIKDIRDFLKTEEGRKKFVEIINERIENKEIFVDFTNSLKKFRPAPVAEEPVVEETVVYEPVVEGGLAR